VTSLIPTLRAAMLGAVSLCLGCPGTLDDPSRFLPDGSASGGGCPDVPSSVFTPKCALAGCHTSTDKIQGLDLQSPGVAGRLVGVCARGGGLLVDPVNASASVVYTKLTLAPPFGSRMPLGRAPLDEPTMACVLAWIAEQKGSAAACGDDGGAGLDGAGGDGPQPQEGGD
jgi:hypothetical protein